MTNAASFSGNAAPREPSTTSWSVGATATDSPGRYSLNDSNKGMSVTRGDSLAYSEDSQDQKMLMLRMNKTTTTTHGEPGRIHMGHSTTEYVGRFSKKQSLNDSQLTDESMQDINKKACCSVQ